MSTKFRASVRRTLGQAVPPRNDAVSFTLSRIPFRICASTIRLPLQKSRLVHTTVRDSAIALPHDKTQTLTNSREAASKCFSTSSRARHGPDAASASPISTSSVSSSEVDHFSRLASSWWDPHGPSRLLHLMNPLRFDFLQSLFTQDHTANQQRTYLDVGCGGGIFASACARHPGTSSVLAIDPTPACVAVAQAHQRRDPAIQPPKLTYLNTALGNIPEDKNGNRQTFDVITLFEVIEHISSPAAFLQNAAEHLKPGGWLVGSTIARSPVSYITTKLVAEAPLVGVVPAGTHDWNQYINPDELRGWFEKQTESAAVGGPGAHRWGSFTTRGVIYVPALGWKVVQGSESYGNYFFAAQKLPPLST